MPQLSTAARQKALADVRELLNALPTLNPQRDEYASARFEGSAFALLTRIATVLETGDARAEPYLDGPAWVREIEVAWHAALRRHVDDADMSSRPPLSRSGKPDA